MKRKMVQMKIRVPANIHKRLKQSARRNQISFNAECVRRIEATFAKEFEQNASNEIFHQIQHLSLMIGAVIDFVKLDDRSAALRGEIWHLTRKQADTPAPV